MSTKLRYNTYCMQKKTTIGFPKRFLWGAAISAHQVEGNTHNQWTEWEQQQAKTLATQSTYHYSHVPYWPQAKRLAQLPANYISGSAVKHYELYEEDFGLLEQMHMNALRFSIEWSRVEPEEGSWDPSALHHYKQYIQALKKRGIEPIVTLFHFTLPVWFDQMGGFEKRANVAYFVRFVEKVMTELGAHMRYVITINEPNVYANESYAEGNWPPNVRSKRSAFTVLNNLVRAHKQARAVIKQIQRRAKVSVAYNSSYVYAGDDAWLTRTAARAMQWGADDYYLSRVAKHCDFLGINYYFSNRVYGYRVHNANQVLSDLGWEVYLEQLAYSLVRLWEKYHLPIMITENGIADAGDTLRKEWLVKTISAMQLAQQQGVNLLGYLHWSLLDNFEWDKGRWPRFGLAEVDYRTYQRTLRPSALWFGKVIEKLRKQ